MGSNLKFIHYLVQIIHKEYEVKTRDEPKFIKLTRHNKGNIIMNQKQYIKNIGEYSTLPQAKHILYICYTQFLNKENRTTSVKSIIDRHIN